EVCELEAEARHVQLDVLRERGVSAGQDEPVASDPLRVGGVVSHHPLVEGVRERGQAHRRARMSTPAVLDGLRREHPSGGDRARVQVRPVGGGAGGGELGDLRRAGHWWFSRVEGAARIRAYVLAHSNGRRGAGWPGPCPRLFAAPPPWT